MLKAIKTVLKLYDRHWHKLFLVMVIMTFEVALTGLIVLQFKKLLDEAIVATFADGILTVIFNIILMTLLVKIGTIARTWLYAKMIASITMETRVNLYERINEIAFSDLIRMPKGQLFSHFTEDISSLEDVTTIAFPVATVSFMTIAINLIFLSIINLRLTMFAVLGLFFCVLTPLLVKRLVSKYQSERKKAQEKLLGQIDMRMDAMREVMAFGLSDTLASRFKNEASRVAGIARRAYFFSEIMEILPKLMIELMNVIIIVIGIFLIASDTLTAGALITFNTLYSGVAVAVGSMTWAIPLLTASNISIERLNQFLEGVHRDNDVFLKERLSQTQLLSFESAIKLENIVFGYGANQILNGVSLEVPKGKRVAIIGKSGSGKSTLLNILLGFYNVSSGSVKLDQSVITSENLPVFRKRFGMVFQKNVMFPMTILENFKLVNPECTEEMIEAALEAVDLYDVVNAFPEKLNYKLGTQNAGLSGGQLQRLALARAMVVDPEVYVFDEITSALDVQSEMKITALCEHLSKGKTTITITHRLWQIESYDLIYVLDKGHLAESGSHRKLLAKNGIYAELYRKQSGFTLTQSGEYKISSDRLKSMPMFSALPLEFLHNIKNQFKAQSYDAGEYVMYEGELGRYFYIIARGRVAVLKGENEFVLTHLEAGDFFGEIALLKSVPRTASVKCENACTFLCLKQDDFRSLLNMYPELKADVLSEIDKRLKEQ